MVKRVVEASPESLETLARLRAEKKRRDADKLAELDVFSLIGYEPTCIPRVEARKRVAKRLGIPDWRDPRTAETGELPDLCGKCPQELFHAATESDVLFGGAAGGGKSVALVAEAIKWCSRYPNLRALLVRRTYGELAESILPALRKFSFCAALGCKWNGVHYELRWPGGSLLTLRYLETVDDASRRQGGELQWLGCDEGTLLAPGILDFLRYERLRSGGGQPVVGIRVTANPGGPSHAQIKERYVTATDNGRRVVTDDYGMTIRFIRSLPQDNPHLDPGYLKRLDAIPDQDRRAAMRDGDWDRFGGMMFPEYSEDRHIVDPIPIPASWRKFNGIDWGFAKPWFVGWNAVDPDGRVWVYREIYETGVGEEEQARRILAAEADDEQIAVRYADDAMWVRRSADASVKSVAEVYAENGVWLTRAGKTPGSRIQGWQRWHTYLAEYPACPLHRAMGWETCPRIHIFSTCPNLKSELRSLPRATTGDPEDSDPKAADHGMDGEKYFLLNLDGGAQFFASPEAPQPGPGELLTPMGQWAVREDPNAPVSTDPDKPKVGLTQTWEQALAAVRSAG